MLHDIELGCGALVVVHLTLSRPEESSVVRVAILEPGPPFADAEELGAHLDTPAGRRSRQVLVGGSSLQAPIQFHDLQAGDHRVCAILLNPQKLVCQPVQIPGQASVIELSLRL